jgi:transcriptional regulator with XRE-family HTH domain
MSDGGEAAAGRSGNAFLRDALVEARRRASLTQHQLAALLDVPQPTVARIETGKRKVEAVELVVIARALDIDVVDLMRRLEQATPEGERF